MIAAVSVALSLTVLPVSAAQINTSTNFDPLPSLGELNSSNYTNGFYIGDTGNAPTYVSSLSGSIYLSGYMTSGSSTCHLFAFSYTADSSFSFYRYRYSNPVSGTTTVSNTSSDLNGFFVEWLQTSADPSTLSIPIFDSRESLFEAFLNEPVDSSAAVLVSPSESYEYQTGFTLTNSSSSPVAAGWVGDSFYLASLDANIACQNPTVSFYLRLFDNTTSLYYSIGTLQGTSDDRIGPVFVSSSDFFTSALSVLTGTGGAVADYSDYPTQFSLLPGYVGYIHLADPSDEIVLKADFDLYSNSLFGDSYWRKTMTYRDNTTLPINPRTYPVSGSTSIAWQKDPSGRTDLLGRTKSGIAVLHPTSNLIEIYNPYYSYAGGTPLPGADISTMEFNPTIYGITGPILSFVSYPVDSSFTASVGAITIDSTGNIDKPVIGDIVPGNPVIDTYRDKDDDPVVPVVGGDNSPPSGSDITDILNDFFNRITGLFTAGHDAIRNLVEGSSEFVSQLSGLYSWLPAPVLSVLTSAVILAIIIGVLKVFL